jgi:PAS domain S-box-containing protein
LIPITLPPIVGLAQNMALLVLGVLAYSWLKEQLIHVTAGAQTAMEAALFSALVLVAMSNPYIPAPGVFVDSRGALIACATLFAGPVVGLATSAVAALFRFWLGGDYLLTALMTIGATYFASLGFRNYLRLRAIEPRYLHLVLLGFAVCLCMIGTSMTLPNFAFALQMLHRTAFAVFLIVPLTTALLGSIILRMENQRRLVRAVADGEARFRGVLHHLPNPLAIRDLDGRFTYINPAFEQQFRVGTDAIGQTRPKLITAMGLKPGLLDDVDARVVDDGAVVKSGPVALTLHGRQQWLALWNFPIRTADGAIEAVGGMVENVTDFAVSRQALERREETLRRHQMALLEIVHSGVFDTTSRREAFKAIAEIAGEAMEADRTMIFRIEPDIDVQRCLDLWDRKNHEHSIVYDTNWSDLGELFAELDRNRVVAVDDIDTDPRLAPRLWHYQKFDIQSLLTAGIYVDGQRRGRLNFGMVGAKRQWQPQEIAFARSVADLIAQVFLAKDREGLQQKLQQSAKMEAIGQLAGGVAHDFNNLLGSILGFAGFLKQDLPPGSEPGRFAQRIMSACERGRGLVAEILSFAKSASDERRVLDLGALLRDSEVLLAESLPKTTRLNFRYPAAPVSVECSDAQLNQIIMNLCINANDALNGESGRITVSLGSVRPRDADWKRVGAAAPGRILVGQLDGARAYATIEVSDTGVGMNPDVLEHVMEPFFTTKERGRGTGLGLAVVHGIVMSYGGAYGIESSPGKGTTVTVHLPLSNGKPLPVADKPAAKTDVRGKERVLVIDDEEDLADMMAIGLGRLGYDAVGVNDAVEALESVEADTGAWDVVVTDQVMPRMRGLTLVSKLRELSSDLKVILCTGFSDGATEETARKAGADGFFLKPVGPQQVAEKIRSLMNASPC